MKQPNHESKAARVMPAVVVAHLERSAKIERASGSARSPARFDHQ
jgi:hypothetical protein